MWGPSQPASLPHTRQRGHCRSQTLKSKQAIPFGTSTARKLSTLRCVKWSTADSSGVCKIVRVRLPQNLAHGRARLVASSHTLRTCLSGADRPRGCLVAGRSVLLQASPAPRHLTCVAWIPSSLRAPRAHAPLPRMDDTHPRSEVSVTAAAPDKSPSRRDIELTPSPGCTRSGRGHVMPNELRPEPLQRWGRHSSPPE